MKIERVRKRRLEQPARSARPVTHKRIEHRLTLLLLCVSKPGRQRVHIPQNDSQPVAVAVVITVNFEQGGAQPLCGSIAALISVNDTASRPPRALKDGEELSLGRHTVRWLDTPHLPHGWDCGYLFESSTATLLCGDLFTQPGDKHVPITEGDIPGPSEAMLGQMDYYAHARNTRMLLEKVAATRPKVLACMHGSAWRGDGAKLLMQLATSLEAQCVDLLILEKERGVLGRQHIAHTAMLCRG